MEIFLHVTLPIFSLLEKERYGHLEEYIVSGETSLKKTEERLERKRRRDARRRKAEEEAAVEAAAAEAAADSGDAESMDAESSDAEVLPSEEVQDEIGGEGSDEDEM